MYVYAFAFICETHRHTAMASVSLCHSHTRSCSVEACDLRWMAMTGFYLQACKSALHQEEVDTKQPES